MAEAFFSHPSRDLCSARILYFAKDSAVDSQSRWSKDWEQFDVAMAEGKTVGKSSVTENIWDSYCRKMWRHVGMKVLGD